MIGLITGGTQGLGEATARLFAERGATGLVVVGRNRDRGEAVADSISGQGCPTIFVGADLSDADAPARIVQETVERFGRVDALVSCAASTGRGSVWDSDPELWDLMYTVNLRCPGLLITECAKVMSKIGEGGTIVNVGSVAAAGGQDYLYPYAATKGALVALTRNGAFNLMRHRIRVNLVQPGWMDTEGEDLTQRKFHGASDGWQDEAAKRLPFGRLVDPDEVARTIHFLSSSESGLITGSIIDIDQSVLGGGDVSRPDLQPIWGEIANSEPTISKDK